MPPITTPPPDTTADRRSRRTAPSVRTADGSRARKGDPGATPEVGSPVEVRIDFSGRWVPGFAVAERRDRSCRLRRTSDAAVLPAWFDESVIRSPGS